jgi:holo-[acyl-carrier protein] synthase
MILSIGVDIVEPERIAGVMERHGERFLARTFTAREISYCRGRKRAVEHFAARWAAKEAVAKALGTGFDRRIGWKDIEVVKSPSGAVRVQLHRKARTLAGKLGVARIHLSLSHTAGAALALVVLEK